MSEMRLPNVHISTLGQIRTAHTRNYVCGHNKFERGAHCDYKARLRKTDIEPLVIEAIKEMVNDKTFAEEIKKRIGTQVDTTTVDKEIANYNGDATRNRAE